MNSYNGFTPAQRAKAQAWLNSQWNSGALARPCECHACGQTEGVIDAHAEDYSEPFAAGKTDEFHLCFICHMMVHCRYRNRQAWENYKNTVMDGGRYPAYKGRNWTAFAESMLEGVNPLTPVFYDTASRDVFAALEDRGAQVWKQRRQ